jgi:hypothetical protein
MMTISKPVTVALHCRVLLGRGMYQWCSCFWNTVLLSFQETIVVEHRLIARMTAVALRFPTLRRKDMNLWCDCSSNIMLSIGTADVSGETPLSYATKKHDLMIQALLERDGAVDKANGAVS